MNQAFRQGPLEPAAILRDRYHIEGLVGQGGAGFVYRAGDLRLPGRITAIKEIQPDPGATDELRLQTREQFHREASILAQLDHPALPKVSDFFTIGDSEFLVMDFVTGPDLREVVEEARAEGVFLDPKRVLAWMAQLLEVVEYLHSLSPPVIHRDIKPANIKLVEGGRVKLVDFGLVKPLDPADPRTLTVARGLGSLPYTPLEQYAGDTGHTDVRADVYALGATLYHLLVGRAPATAQERFLMPNALQRPSRLNPEISGRLEAAILRAMALHPAKRPESVADLRALLFGEAPLFPDLELETSEAVWRQALWDNAGLIALAGLLLVLALIATWQAGV
jgi:eukaryotic-like serine/threonine-protein kinase